MVRCLDGLILHLNVSLPHAVQRHQLVEQVIQKLRRRIALGEFAIGAKLPSESELMAQFAVGRSTVREAVRALVHGGMLDVRQGDGTYVRGLSQDTALLLDRLRRARAGEVYEVYEVRRALELEIARLAAIRRDDADLATMWRLLARRHACLAAGDEEEYLDADVEFHVAVAAATKNAVLTDLYRAFATALRDALGALIDLQVTDRVETASLHDLLADAIARRDTDAAVDITLQHLDGTAARLRQTLSETDAG